MGEAPPSKEHILCLLPIPSNQAILDSIIKKHPNVEITYKQLNIKKGIKVDPQDIPDGNISVTPHVFYLT
jgi:hypothetical protein